MRFLCTTAYLEAANNERVLCVSMKTPSYQSKFTLENPVITAEDNLMVITGKQSAVLPGTPGFNVKLKMLNDGTCRI